MDRLKINNNRFLFSTSYPNALLTKKKKRKGFLLKTNGLYYCLVLKKSYFFFFSSTGSFIINDLHKKLKLKNNNK